MADYFETSDASKLYQERSGVQTARFASSAVSGNRADAMRDSITTWTVVTLAPVPSITINEEPTPLPPIF